MATQLKFVVDEALAERFKRAVLEKHGKLELSKEGAAALRMYLDAGFRGTQRKGPDPLLSVIGIARSRGRARSALRDKKRLYEEA